MSFLQTIKVKGLILENIQETVFLIDQIKQENRKNKNIKVKKKRNKLIKNLDN
jgi:hypothetical protein